MARNRRTFTREFKLEIMRQLEHQSKAQLCREHNIQPQLIDRWIREQRDYPKAAFKGKGNLFKLEAQLAESQRLVGELYAENAILKKTITFFQERKVEEKMLRSTK